VTDTQQFKPRRDSPKPILRHAGLRPPPGPGAVWEEQLDNDRRLPVPERDCLPVHLVIQGPVSTRLNDASAAEQAFIFSGLAKGRNLTRWQTGPALRKTLEAATGPGGHALRVSLAQPLSPQRGKAGVIYIGLSTHKQLDLATYTSNHHELQIIVSRPPVLS
jgi:hypothetical protein